MEYYCEKDNRQTDISKGCRHPKDFCQHRQACMIHFLEQEEKRNRKHEADTASKPESKNEENGQRM